MNKAESALQGTLEVTARLADDFRVPELVSARLVLFFYFLIMCGWQGQRPCFYFVCAYAQSRTITTQIGSALVKTGELSVAAAKGLVEYDRKNKVRVDACLLCLLHACCRVRELCCAVFALPACDLHAPKPNAVL